MIPINLVLTINWSHAVGIGYLMMPGIAHVLCYFIRYAQQKLLLSNDVELNPGPDYQDYATKEDIKEVNVRLDRVLNGIEKASNQWSALQEKVNGLEDQIAENEKQIDVDHKDIDSLSQRIGFLETKLDRTNEELEKTQEHNKKMQKHLNDLEDRNKRNNLIFSGVPEDKNETWQQSEIKVKNIIRNQMKLEEIEIERAHRMQNGSLQNGAKPIIVKFTKYKDKERVLNKTIALTGSNIFVNQDYCKNTRDVQKILREKRKEFKDLETVKKAVIRYKKLVVTDKAGNVSVFEYDEDDKEVVSK
jgi:hypothetical protein